LLEIQQKLQGQGLEVRVAASSPEGGLGRGACEVADTTSLGAMLLSAISDTGLLSSREHTDSVEKEHDGECKPKTIEVRQSPRKTSAGCERGQFKHHTRGKQNIHSWVQPKGN